MAQKAKIFEALLTSQRAQGVTLSGGKVYFYTPGTLTLKTIYADRNKQVVAANPFTLDSNGQGLVYGDGLYDVQVKNSTLAVSLPLWEDVKIGDPAGETFANVADYASLEAAVAAIGATKTTLIVGADQSVANNLTIPATLELQVINGAIITVASTKTLTINGPFDAPSVQVFAGSGAVTGLNESCPEWFGTNTAALIKALASAPKTILVPDKTYPMDLDFIIDISKSSLIGSNSILDFSTTVPSSTYAIKVTSTATGLPYYSGGHTLEGFHVKGNIPAPSIQYGVIYDRAIEPGVSNVILMKVSIYGFVYGEYYKDNAYNIGHIGCNIFNNTYGISNSATTTNGGERISYNQCSIFNNSINIWNNYASADFAFSDCSVDYPGAFQIKTTGGKLYFSNCHLEGNTPLLDQTESTYISFSSSEIWQMNDTGATPFITVNGGTVSITGGKLSAPAGTTTLVNLVNLSPTNFTLIGTFVNHPAPLAGRYVLNGTYFIKDSDNNTFVSSKSMTSPGTISTTGVVASTMSILMTTQSTWYTLPVSPAHGLFVLRDTLAAQQAVLLADYAGTAVFLHNSVTGLEAQISAGSIQLRNTLAANRNIQFILLKSGE